MVFVFTAVLVSKIAFHKNKSKRKGWLSAPPPTSYSFAPTKKICLAIPAISPPSDYIFSPCWHRPKSLAPVFSHFFTENTQKMPPPPLANVTHFALFGSDPNQPQANAIGGIFFLQIGRPSTGYVLHVPPRSPPPEFSSDYLPQLPWLVTPLVGRGTGSF